MHDKSDSDDSESFSKHILSDLRALRNHNSRIYLLMKITNIIFIHEISKLKLVITLINIDVIRSQKFRMFWHFQH